MHLQSQNFYSKIGGGEQRVTGRSWQRNKRSHLDKWKLRIDSRKLVCRLPCVPWHVSLYTHMHIQTTEKKIEL